MKLQIIDAILLFMLPNRYSTENGLWSLHAIKELSNLCLWSSKIGQAQKNDLNLVTESHNMQGTQQDSFWIVSDMC